MKRTFSLSLLLSAFCLSTAAHAVDVTGAGSSFVFPVLSKWSQGFSEKTGNRINYQSIGYVEYAYALTNKMTHVQLKNAAGNFVQPEAKSFQAAAATADWKSAKDFNLLMTNAPGADAWPITATTWIVMYKEPKNEERSKVAFDFFKWSLEHGQKDAAALDYVPVPDTLVKQIEGYWASDFKK